MAHFMEYGVRIRIPLYCGISWKAESNSKKILQFIYNLHLDSRHYRLI